MRKSPYVLSAITVVCCAALAIAYGLPNDSAAENGKTKASVSKVAVTSTGVTSNCSASGGCSFKAKSSATGGCSSCDLAGIDTNAKPTLNIRWKRLVNATGETVASHTNAEKELDQAFIMLKSTLSPLGVDVVFQKAAVDKKTFAQDPTSSNRVWINGAALTSYLPNAKVGKIVDKQERVFRTVEFAGTSFRDVPKEMLVKVGLIAAVESIKENLAEVHLIGVTGGKSCCDAGGTSCCSKSATASLCNDKSYATAKTSKGQTLTKGSKSCCEGKSCEASGESCCKKNVTAAQPSVK